MASQLKVDTLTGVTTAGSIDVTGEGNSTTTNLQQGLAKGFLIYDQPDVLKSFNVSTVTDRSTGRSTTNFTNSFTDNNISIASTGQYPTGGSDGYWSCISDDHGNTSSTTSSANMVQTYGRNDEEIFWDSSRQHAVYHGDLA
mgnify:CR=1 FL=1